MTVAVASQSDKHNWDNSAALAPVLALLHIEDIITQLPRQPTIMLPSHLNNAIAFHNGISRRCEGEELKVNFN